MSSDINISGANKMTAAQDLPAGSFSSWLRQTRSAMIKGSGIEVPCGDCYSCCRSSYFIHIWPHETQTIAHIDKKLLFPAPGEPKGKLLLGYNEQGRCPLLIDNKCSIYQHRSLTCRSYDCRIFAAAGIAAGDDDKALINQHIKRWKFSYPTERDRSQHRAVQAAAAFIRDHAQCFPGGNVPTNPTQLAILAIKVYSVFLKYCREPGQAGRVPSDIKLANAIVKANENFEARRSS